MEFWAWFLFGFSVLVLSAIYLSCCFAFVDEGTSRQVVRFGGYLKTLIQKEGYAIDASGELCTSVQRGWLPRGLFWVSIWKPLGIDKIYKRTMKFVRAMPDGTYEKHADENTDFLLTGTQYQYALLFSSAEDSNRLPLSGQMTMTAMITNPYKALFLVKDWFDALVSRVLPRVRQYISEHTYDQIIYDPAVQLDADVFDMLHEKDPADPSSRSILDILHQEYGIRLVALETVNVDPPENYRSSTLQKWQAAQNAAMEAEETGGALTLMVDQQIEAAQKHHKLTKAEKKEIRAQCLNMLLRDRAAKTGGLKDIRVANADGTSFGRGSIGEIVAGVAAAVTAAATGKTLGSQGDRKDGGKGGGKSSNGKSDKDIAEETFEQTGGWPSWWDSVNQRRK